MGKYLEGFTVSNISSQLLIDVQNSNYLDFLSISLAMHSSLLQMRAVFVAFCRLGVNLIDFFLPRQVGVIVDVLVSRNGESFLSAKLPLLTWEDHQWLIEIAIYAALTLAKSDCCFKWLRRWLSYPIEDCSYISLCKATQAHAMGLSSDFHTLKGANKIFFTAFKGKCILELVDTISF